MSAQAPLGSQLTKLCTWLVVDGESAIFESGKFGRARERWNGISAHTTHAISGPARLLTISQPNLHPRTLNLACPPVLLPSEG